MFEGKVGRTAFKFQGPDAFVPMADDVPPPEELPPVENSPLEIVYSYKEKSQDEGEKE